MIQELQVSGKNDIANIQDKLLELTFEVPFGNSDYQNRKIVVGGQMTPERAYRHSALRIQNRLSALNDCYFGLKEREIDIELLEREIEELNKEQPKNFDLEVRRKENEIEKLRSQEPMTKKLISDAVAEINSLLPIINSMGKLSKEQFELGEKAHFEAIHSNILAGKNDHVLALDEIRKEVDLFEQIQTKNLLK